MQGGHGEAKAGWGFGAESMWGQEPELPVSPWYW